MNGKIRGKWTRGEKRGEEERERAEMRRGRQRKHSRGRDGNQSAGG